MTMTPDEIEALFSDAAGNFRFARWGRPIAPIVFGVDDATLNVFKGAVEALSALTQHPLTETDTELGSNLMFFLFRDWAELVDLPNLDKLVPELGALVTRLEAQGANQYRLFRFDEQGAIKAAFVFIRMDGPLADWPAESLALAEASQVFLLWGEQAFSARSPLARLPNGADILRPEIGDVLRAAYAPELPQADEDSAFALRLFARVSALPRG
ncbi:DUF2927 domain-containing protein [Lentibacter sp. XHP0401]|jgi:hypothetical protein|nr:DUF2927 domain-containing protein [Lentibacter sp. XHP0401]MCV2894147.1 DUF2927 domain-containing protein [Lentibacter sp. XHP0401]